MMGNTPIQYDLGDGGITGGGEGYYTPIAGRTPVYDGGRGDASSYSMIGTPNYNGNFSPSANYMSPSYNQAQSPGGDRTIGGPSPLYY